VGQLLSSNGEDEEEKANKLENVCTQLDMSEEHLRRLQKVNGTKTARAIVRAFYPPAMRMSVVVDEIEPEFRQAIHGIFLFII
jgi:hypothetical protein